MDRLKKKIDTTLEKDIQLKTRGVFRPITRQIGNSLADIKDFYDDKSEEGVTVVPSECPPHLKHYKDCLLHHLKAGSFLFKTNIVTGTEAAQPLLILMDSLALAMDLEVVARPNDVVCDVLLAVCNQPVIVLTLVDGKRKSDTLNEYNTSVAREVTGKLKTFMDERVCVVSGVCCSEDIVKPYKFYDILKEHAQKSSIFIPQKTFETPLSKLNNIVTAIWASVAETNSVKNEDIKRFLTMEQCVVLLENINKKEVKVYHKPGSGATTLMLEVARRLSRLNRTTLVSKEDDGRKGVLPPIMITSKELPTSGTCRTYAKIVVEDTGERMQVTKQQRCWTFVQLKEDEKDQDDSSKVEYSRTKRPSRQDYLEQKQFQTARPRMCSEPEVELKGGGFREVSPWSIGDHNIQGCNTCKTLTLRKSKYPMVHMAVPLIKSSKQPQFYIEFNRLVSAVRNSGGGLVLFHISGFGTSERSRAEVLSMIGPRLEHLLENGRLFVNTYQVEWLNSFIKKRFSQIPEDQYSDIVSVDAFSVFRVTTVNFNTRITNGYENVNLTFEQVVRYLKDKQKFLCNKPRVRGLANIQESYTFTIDTYFWKYQESESRLQSKPIEFAEYIWETWRLGHYVSAFSKVEGGGSFYLHIEGFTYNSHDDLHALGTAIRNQIRSETLVLLFDSETSPAALPPEYVEIDFHKVPSRGVVLEVVIAAVNGLVFHAKEGPEAYELDDKNKLRRLDVQEWKRRLLIET